MFHKSKMFLGFLTLAERRRGAACWGGKGLDTFAASSAGLRTLGWSNVIVLGLLSTGFRGS